MTQSRVAQVMVWIGAGLVVLALTCRAISIHVPVFDWDEYAFALVARDVLHGKLPFAGIFDNKPVGLTYVFALMEWMGGQTVLAVRAVGFIASAGTAWILYRSARQLRVPPALGVAIAALFLFLVFHKNGWSSMSELVACPSLALANHLVLQGAWRRRGFLLGFGALFGVTCQITYLAVPCLALMAPGILLLGTYPTIFARLRDAALMALGFGVVTALIWTPQLLTGDWPDYIAQQVHYHAQYRVASPSLREWAHDFITPLSLLSLPLLGALGLRIWGERSMPVLPAPFWVIGLELLGAVMAAAVSNRLHPHYFILALPAIALLTAMAFARSAERSSRIGCILLLSVTAVLAVLSVDTLRAAIQKPSFETQAAMLVDRFSNADQGIFVFNETHAIYFLSRREAVSSYVFPGHYIAHDGGTPLLAPSSALAQALARHPALLVIGFMYPVALDAGAMAREAGYQMVQQMTVGGRHIDLYCDACRS